MGKKLAKSDVGDALKRMVDTIERLEPKMARGHEGRYAEIGAIMCRVTVIEVLQGELRDNEDEERRAAVRHAFARRSTTSHKLSSSR